MLAISDRQFAMLVSEVLDELPEEHRYAAQNIAFIYDNQPSRSQSERLKLHKGQELLGLYEGVPLTRRQGRTGYPPDKITLFKIPLLERANTMAELKKEIKHTIWHELAHYFGLGHPAIAALEKKGDLAGPICSDIRRQDREMARKAHKHAHNTSGQLSRSLREFFHIFLDPELRGFMVLGALILGVGTGFYMIVEGWDIIEAFYFSVSSLTTVGYGDLHATNDLSRLFTSIYVLTGVGFILSFVNVIAHQVTKPVIKRIRRASNLRGEPRDIND